MAKLRHEDVRKVVVGVEDGKVRVEDKFGRKRVYSCKDKLPYETQTIMALLDATDRGDENMVDLNGRYWRAEQHYVFLGGAAVGVSAYPLSGDGYSSKPRSVTYLLYRKALRGRNDT